jgi:hypothetical protein
MSNPSTQRRLSSRNPFQTPLLTPNPTGTSTTSSAPSYHTAVPFSHTLLTPTPTGMSTMSSTPSYHTAAESHIHSDDEDTPEALPELTPRIPSRNLSNPRRLSSSSSLQSASTSLPPRLTPSAAPQPPSSALPSDLPPDFTLDDIPEVPPPAYSLTPDIDSGETFLVQDPSEPFQHAPEPPVQLPPSPPPPPPPPSPPSSFPERPLSPLSEFEAPPSPTTPLEQQPRYAPPPGRPPPASSVRQHSRITPPSGAPPPPNRPRVASTSSGAGSTASPASSGHPTSTPTPGRPLLRNGRTLVYPESYLCHKCKLRSPHSLSFSLSHGAFSFSRTRFRQQHGLQELRPVAPVSQMLGPLWQAFFGYTRIEPVGRPEQQLREPEPARSHIPAAPSLV